MNIQEVMRAKVRAVSFTLLLILYSCAAAGLSVQKLIIDGTVFRGQCGQLRLRGGAALDDQCTGMGFYDLDTTWYYTDAMNRPERAPGMPHQMRSLIENLSDYNRRTAIVPELQEEEDERNEERRQKMLQQQVIPRKIWQHCSRPIPRLKRAYAKTWATVNPEYVHTICDENEAREFVEKSYPGLKEVYIKLRDLQARIDFWSYLVLYKHGGIFAAIDSTCERPMKEMIGPKDDFIAGLQPKIDSRILAKQVGLQHHTWPLQQWCFASSPGHPILRFLIDYIAQNIDMSFCKESTRVDTLLRTGAGLFTDAVLAFRQNPVDSREVRFMKVGAFALGQVWGSMAHDTVLLPCARERHGYGFWFDNAGKKHQCDCPTRQEKAKRLRGQKEDPCYVRRRNIEGAGVKSLVKFPELARRRWKSRMT